MINSQSYDVECKSVIRVNKVSSRFVVDVEGWSALGKKLGVPVISSAVDCAGHKWCLHIYPAGFKSSDSGFLSVFLKNLSQDDLHINFKMTLRTKGGGENHVGQENNITLMSKKDIGFSKFISVEDLEDPEFYFLQDDCIALLIDITVFDRPEIYSIPNTPCITTSAQTTRSLAEDLSTMLQDEESADMKLVAGGESIYVHKSILMARSPVFRAMFRTCMSESANNVVEIPDIEPDILRLLVEFIYTDICKEESLSKSADAILAAACKYQIMHLATLCDAELLKSLTVASAPNLLVLADRHSRDCLKDAVLQFIGSHVSECVRTEAFDHVGLDLCRQVLRSVTETPMRSTKKRKLVTWEL